MKCHMTSPCETVKNLLLDIDLRVEPSVRIASVAQKIVPLNDTIGENHISASLTFEQDKQTRHTNLPVFVSENETERILCILFPEGIYANIRKDRASTKVNLLEFHIDKLTEAVSEISGIDNGNRIINAFPVEGGTDAGEQATVNERLYQPLSQLLAAIANNTPVVVISTEGEYVSYDLSRPSNAEGWQGTIGVTRFTRDADDHVVYNHQYYELPAGFKGEINESYTRYWKTKTLAAQDDIVQKVDLGISQKTADSNVIDNTAGTGFTLTQATTTEAGLMTAGDRQRMTQLFDGTMIDKNNTLGYHCHNYLEMADLPPTVEMAVSNYTELKQAVLKLQTEAIPQGKFGKIVLTNNIQINDNTELDLNKITIDGIYGQILLENNRSFRFRGITTIENTAFLEFGSRIPTTNRPSVICADGNVTFNNCLFNFKHQSDRTPDIIYNRSQDSSFRLTLNNCLGRTNQFEKYPEGRYGLYIEVNAKNQSAYVEIRNFVPSVFNTFNTAEIERAFTVKVDLNNGSDISYVQFDDSCICQTAAQCSRYTSDIVPFASQTAGRGTLIPSPAAATRTQYHVLCGDGVWRDVRSIQ